MQKCKSDKTITLVNVSELSKEDIVTLLNTQQKIIDNQDDLIEAYKKLLNLLSMEISYDPNN